MNMGKLSEGWSLIKFGDVAYRVAETVVPTPEQSRHYIGLEHMKSDSHLISEWGSDVDLDVMKTPVHKGDVLFARRNTHLRRCALAPFDTIFSPDGYALRTKDQRVLLQEFLLHVVASENFMDFAVEHSAGTHSKRVKWTSLEQYEFALPPVEEQRQIVDVIAAVYELELSYSALSESSQIVGSALLEQTVSTSHMERLADLVTDIRAGSTPRRSEPGYYGGTVPWLKSGEVNSGRISITTEYVTERALAETPVWLMPVGTVVVAMYGDGKTAGSVGILEKPMVCNQAVLGLVADRNRVLPDYLYWVLRRQKDALRNQRAGSSQANLNKEIMGNFEIPVPPLSEQEDLMVQVSQVEGLTWSAELVGGAAKILGASLRERLLGGHHV